MEATNTKLREDMEQNIERLVKGITASFGASCEVQFWRGYPTLENDPQMVANDPVEREFREINRHIEIGARWSDEGVERVARFLEEVKLDETRLEFL